jgi:hypothetical protein
METKHTKEYAEQMYLKQLDDFKETGFCDGYMKAIEETAAPDMLSVLREAVDHAHVYDTNPALVELFEAVIQKATN